MPRGKTKDRDGIYQRKDRPGQFWGSWIDASGKRRQRKLTAHTLQQARTLLNAEKARVEKTVTLGYAPPSAESLEAVSKRFLKHQKARLTPAAYKREQGILDSHLNPSSETRQSLQPSGGPTCKSTSRIAAAKCLRLPS